MLPEQYTYHFVSIDPLKPYHKSPQLDQSDMFISEVRTSIKTKKEALQWVEDFTAASSTDWRVRFNYKENTKCLIFKVWFSILHHM